MAKNRQDKIDKLEAQIAEQQNQLKLEKKLQNEERRKAKQKRQITRHGFLESTLPDLINLTDEQYKIFISEHVANVHGKKALAKLVAEIANTTAEKPQNATVNHKPTITKTATSEMQAPTQETP